MSASTTVHRHANTGRPTGSPLTGTVVLTRFLLRRDRVKLPAWVGGLGVFVLYIGAALPQLAPTEDDLDAMSPLLAQPVGRMFTGPAFGMDDPTYERFFAAGYAPYLFLLAGLMNIMLVTRHTRVEEQTGRAELLRANVTGRHTALTATMVVATITNLLAALVVVALAVANGFAPTGSVLVGAATGLTGMAFAGVTATTVQLSEYSRTAAGMAGMVLGASFALRAVGDMAGVGGTALSWASPLGWPAQTAPYVHDRWAPLLLLVACAAVTTVAAFVLQARRDFGASLIAARPGPAHARPSLGSPLGLAARLQRGGLLGWGTGILVLGVVDGAFTQAMVDAGEDMPPALQEMFAAGGLVDGYANFLGAFVTILVTAYTVFALQTLRSEEGSGRAEAVLATPITRASWLGSHVAAIAAGALLITLLTGIGTGLAAALVTGEGDLAREMVVAHLALLPAAWFVLGLGAALLGIAPRLMAGICWALVVVIGVVEFFASLLDLPDWITALSPMDHLPAYPVEELEVQPGVVTVVLALVLVGAGLAGLRRRQINA